MARSRWIFGNQQNQPAKDSVRPIPLTVASSADSKEFGLENFGNTCYANSVIQTLYFCTPFRDLLIQSPDPTAPGGSADQAGPGPAAPQPLPPLVPLRRPPERPPSSATGSGESMSRAQPTPIPSSPHTLFSALRSLFLHISTHPLDKGTVAPSAFIEQLRRANDMFRQPMHQDAHEFLNYLLNKIVEEIEEDRKLLQNGSADELTHSVATLASGGPPTITTTTTANSSGSRDVTLVHKLFEGTLTSETRCLTCETVSARDESFIDLSIDIEQNSSVTACLRQFSASEMLCHKNKFFCDSCCDLQEAEKRMKIKKLPNVLALHLKRFKIQEDLQNRQKYIKLAYRVAFPFQLRLFNTVDDAEDADRLYNLFGIVVHIGNGPHHGHYISIVKTLGHWLVFDDDNVYPIAESEIPKYYGDSNSGAAYVLYYEAADIDLPALGLRTSSLPLPTLSDASVLHSEPDPASPPQSANPALPPGLTEEGDTSDLSDPAYPVTPSQSSPLLLPTGEKPPRPPLEVNVTNLNDPAAKSASPAVNATPSSPAVNGRGSKGLFSTIRRTPSAKLTGTDTRRSVAENSTSPMGDDAIGKIRPDRTPSPPPSTSHPQPEKKEPERKSNGWFSKRKSFRVGDKKDYSDYPSSPVLPVLPKAEKADDSSTNHTASTSSSLNTSSTRHKGTTNQPRDFKGRRPSEPAMFDAGAFAPISLPRPRSTAENLTVKPHKERRSQTYETPPGSASSSASGSAPPTAFPSSAPGPASLRQLPPPRKSSLSSDPPRSPEHKKSLSHLSRKDKHRSAPTDHPPRPATAAGTTAETISGSRAPPPVPPLPLAIAPEVANGHASAGKGKLREDSHSPVPRPMSAGASTAPGLASASGTNVSAASTSSGATSNLKRATRKLSMSGQMFGFGKKDKEKKEREREEKEREGGKGPPSSYSQY